MKADTTQRFQNLQRSASKRVFTYLTIASNVPTNATLKLHGRNTRILARSAVLILFMALSASSLHAGILLCSLTQEQASQLDSIEALVHSQVTDTRKAIHDSPSRQDKVRALWRFKLFIDDEETKFDNFRKTLGSKSHKPKGQSPSNLSSDPAERVDSLIDTYHETFDSLSIDRPEEFSCDDLDGYLASINVEWVGNGAGEHTQKEYETMIPSEALDVENMLKEICKD